MIEDTIDRTALYIVQRFIIFTECYASKCVQKYNYHRLLVYNPKDYYYPFKVSQRLLSCLVKNNMMIRLREISLFALPASVDISQI